jgi:hypothetical protein
VTSAIVLSGSDPRCAEQDETRIEVALRWRVAAPELQTRPQRLEISYLSHDFGIPDAVGEPLPPGVVEHVVTSGLASGTVYYWRVGVQRSDGWEWSEPARFVTPSCAGADEVGRPSIPSSSASASRFAPTNPAMSFSERSVGIGEKSCVSGRSDKYRISQLLTRVKGSSPASGTLSPAMRAFLLTHSSSAELLAPLLG